MTIIYPEEPGPGGRRIKLTLTEFILARLGEAERRAEAVKARTIVTRSERAFARQVQENAETNRMLATLWGSFLDQAPRWAQVEAPTLLEMADKTLRLLAWPYSDHHEWREEWRP